MTFRGFKTKIIALSAILILLTGLATATINDIEIEPSTYAIETGNTITFDASAQGNNLERLILQSRNQGSSFFTDREQITCSGSSCSTSFTITENSANLREYRVRGHSNSDIRNSNIVKVRTTNNLDYSVNWGDYPPGSAEIGETVSTSIVGQDTGQRFDRDGQVKIQYRKDNSWHTISSRNCDTSSADNFCSHSTSFTIQNRHVDSGEIKLRGLLEFKGGDNSKTERRTISVEREQSAILDPLPNTYPINTDLEISGSAQAHNIDRIIIQQRPETRSSWEDVAKERDCGSSNCAIEIDNYQQSREIDVEFRLRVWTESGDRFNSDKQTVTFEEEEDEEPPAVEDVFFTEIPDSVAKGSRFNIIGQAEGNRLDYVVLEEDLDGSWSRLTRNTCSSSPCSISTRHSVSDSDERDFRIRAIAGEDEDSEVRTVEFFDRPVINNVVLEDLPREFEINEDLTIEASAEGVSIDRLEIKRRVSGQGFWRNIGTESNCGSSCSLDIDYSSSDTGLQYFRAYAYLGDGSDPVLSTTRSVRFVRGESPGISRVNLQNIPDRVSTGSSVSLDASASGNRLSQLNIWYRDDGNSWDILESSSCSGSSCSFSTDFSDDNEYSYSFRAEAEANDLKRNSSIRTTRFVDSDIDRVNIDDLPSRHLVDSNMRISGDASGFNLRRIMIQKRDNGGDWENVTTSSCSGGNCGISTGYSQSETGDVDFRIKAETDTDSMNSNVETVEFYRKETGRINDIILDSLPREHPVDTDLEITGSMEGENLDRINVLYRRSGTGFWNQEETINCGSSTSCSVDIDNFQFSSRELVYFRLKGFAASGKEKYSNTRSVRFVAKPTPPEISSITISRTPQQIFLDEEFSISSQAHGNKLDRLHIQQRKDGGSWSNISERTCSGSRCTGSVTFTGSELGNYQFRSIAEAGSISKTSEIRSTSVIERSDDPEINDVSIAGLPNRVETGSVVNIEGSASGNKLDSLAIQRKSGSTWENISSTSCGQQSSCNHNADFERMVDGVEDFRIKAYAGDLSLVSNIESVEFYTPRVNPRIDRVTINDLPREKFIGENVTVTGFSEGVKLGEIEILRRKSGTGFWSPINKKSCSGTTCEISVDNTASEKGLYYYRVKATAGQDTKYSSTESVRFVERPVQIGKSTLNIDVFEDKTGNAIRDAEITIENSTKTITGFTDRSGRFTSQLYPDTYDVEVSKSGYSSESRTVRMNRNQDRTISFHLKKDEDPVKDSNFEVLVLDGQNNRLRNAFVEVDNSDYQTERTNRHGLAFFRLDPGSYTVTASKTGYTSNSKSVSISSGESKRSVMVLNKLDSDKVSYSDFSHKHSVCRDGDFDISFEVENNWAQEINEDVSFEYRDQSVERSISLKPGESKNVELRLEDVEGLGKSKAQLFDGSGNEVYSFELNSVSCPERTGDTVELSLNTDKESIIVEERLKASGQVKGVRNYPVEVSLNVGGERKTVKTDRNGNYQGFFRPDSVGELDVRAQYSGLSRNKIIDVRPRSLVSNVDHPNVVVVGETFEVCGDVLSSADAENILIREGDRLGSQLGKGEVCFNTDVNNVGRNQFEFRSVNRGEGSSASFTVRGIPDDEEYYEFPDNIQVVESRSGLAKLEIYNRHDSTQNYDLDILGPDSTKFDVSDSNVRLGRGESARVYIHFTSNDVSTTESFFVIERDSEVVFESLLTAEVFERKGSGL